MEAGARRSQKCFWAVLNPVRARTVRRFQGSRTGWIPRSPWYLAYVPSPTNLKMCDRTKPNLDSTHDRTKPNLDSTHELRGCARTVRSSGKASNPTFQPLIGSQAPTPEVLVPVINLVCFSVPNPLCCIDSGGRAGLLTKPYKIEQVPGPFSCRIEQQHLDFAVEPPNQRTERAVAE